MADAVGGLGVVRVQGCRLAMGVFKASCEWSDVVREVSEVSLCNGRSATRLVCARVERSRGECCSRLYCL